MLELATQAVNFIYSFVSAMGTGEQISIVTGIIYIFLSVRENPLCWPFGIVSVGIWMVIVFTGKLYADAFLQAVYVVLGFYGWYQWLRGGKNSSPLPVRRIPFKLAAGLAAGGTVATVLCGFVSTKYLHAAYPWWDSITTVMSLIAQYLLAKKYLSNWILWIIADTIYIFIYYLKGWSGYSLLMVVYTLMAAAGYLQWRKSMLNRENNV